MIIRIEIFKTMMSLFEALQKFATLTYDFLSYEITMPAIGTFTPITGMATVIVALLVASLIKKIVPFL